MTSFLCRQSNLHLESRFPFLTACCSWPFSSFYISFTLFFTCVSCFPFPSFIYLSVFYFACLTCSSFSPFTQLSVFFSACFSCSPFPPFISFFLTLLYRLFRDEWLHTSLFCISTSPVNHIVLVSHFTSDFLKDTCNSLTWLEYVSVTWSFCLPTCINFFLATLDSCARNLLGGVEGKGREERGKKSLLQFSNILLAGWLAYISLQRTCLAARLVSMNIWVAV